MNKTITELFLDAAVKLDGNAEPMYGTGEAFVDYPCVFPTVNLVIHATDALSEIADRMRMAKGYLPMVLQDEYGESDFDGWYEFSVGLNGYTPTHLDNSIDFVVAGSDSADNEDIYHMELSLEEQQIIFDLLDCQCKDAFGKGCEELLEDARRELIDAD